MIPTRRFAALVAIVAPVWLLAYQYRKPYEFPA